MVFFIQIVVAFIRICGILCIFNTQYATYPYEFIIAARKIIVWSPWSCSAFSDPYLSTKYNILQGCPNV